MAAARLETWTLWRAGTAQDRLGEPGHADSSQSAVLWNHEDLELQESFQTVSRLPSTHLSTSHMRRMALDGAGLNRGPKFSRQRQAPLHQSKAVSRSALPWFVKLWELLIRFHVVVYIAIEGKKIKQTHVSSTDNV